MRVIPRICVGVGVVVIAIAAVAQQFTTVQQLTNREMFLRFSAPAGTNYRIDIATNFPADTNLARWSALLTARSAGVNQHTDSAAPYLPTRFYRAEQLTNSPVLTGDHIATTNGDVVIRPVGHATFVMSWNGKIIVNDPTNTGGFAGLPPADLILVSHHHGDHYHGPTLSALRNPSGGVIVVPQMVYDQGTFAGLRPNAVILNYGQITNVHGIQIEAVPAYNGNHAPGVNNAYVVTIGGKRFFTSGDCGDNSEIRNLTNIDVAFLCMNLPFTTNALGATNIIRHMRPKIVYPYHFQNSSQFGNSRTNAEVFKRWLGQDLGIEVRLRPWY
jgi:L-ascorbate metabolism protein UlaG (beta-lactamase superfamily)